MRQRFLRIGSRNAGFVVTVSDRALRVWVPMLMSFAQDGISPQRMVVNLRIFFPPSMRTVRTCCVGAMLYRGRSSISPAAPKRSAKYGFAYVNLYLFHTSLLSQIRRVAWLRPNDVCPTLRIRPQKNVLLM